MMRIKTPEGRMKTLDEMNGPELRGALRAICAQFGHERACFMIWEQGLPPLPSPHTPHRGPHSGVDYRKPPTIIRPGE